MSNNDKTSQLFDRLLLSLSEYLDSQVYIPVKNEIGTETEHSLGMRKEMFKNFMESQVEKLKDDLKDDLKKVDIHQWIFRFTGAAPSGKFEYICRICGRGNYLEIPEDLPIDIPIRYTCKCGAIIYIWQQSNHWHLKITEKLGSGYLYLFVLHHVSIYQAKLNQSIIRGLKMIMESTFWVVFGIVIIALLAFDLGFLQRKAHTAAMKEAIYVSLFYIIISLIFSALIYVEMGADKSFEFLTAWIVEKSLSVDNLFVFLTIFTYFQVNLKYQHRVLFWGILGALVTRGIFIFVGMFAISLIHALIYLLGAILLYTGYKILTKEDEITNPGENRILKIANEYLPVKKDYIGSSFVIRELQTCLEIPLKNRIFKIMSKIPIINRIPTISPKRDFMEGSKTINKMKFLATPLLLVLLVIESTDVVFATDSVPAVLSISRDTFIVYTSNIFAILGLRALYFVVASMMVEFDYLKYGIAIVLSFIGVKMLVSDFYHVSTGLSLAVVVICLTVSVVASLIWKKEKVDNEQIKNASK